MPYAPLQAMLRAGLAVVRPETLLSEVGENAEELRRLIPDVQEDEPLRPVDQLTGRWKLFDAVVGVFRTLTSIADGVVVLVDDAHWADAASKQLLRHLIVADVPGVWFLLTSRSERVSGAMTSSDVLLELVAAGLLHQLPLGGLETTAIELLVNDIAGGDLSVAVTVDIANSSGGNPFFVQELTAHALRHGGSGGIPDSIRASILRRLAGLSADVVEILRYAAVLGADVDVKVLERASGLPLQQVVAAMDDAMAGGLLHASATSTSVYSFRHALVREVVLKGLSGADRARRHWQLADALELLDPVGQQVNEIAFHAWEGKELGDPSVAAVRLLRAAAAALESLAFEQALVFSEQASSALERCNADSVRLFDATIGAAEAATLLGQLERGWKWARAAANQAGNLADPARYCRAAVAYSYGGRVSNDPAIVPMVKAGLELAGEADSFERVFFLAASCTWGYAPVSFPADRLAASRAAVDMARRLCDARALWWALGAVCWNLSGSPDGAELLAAAEEWLDISRKAGTLSVGPPGVAIPALQLGDRSKAEKALDEQEVIARAHHLGLVLHNCLVMRSSLVLAEGDIAEARRLAAEARAVGGPNEVVAIAFAARMTAIRFEEDRIDDLLVDLESVTNTFPQFVAWRSVLAAGLAAGGRHSEARVELRNLVADGLAAIPRDWAFPLALRHLTDAAAELGDCETASELFPVVEPYSGVILVVTAGTSIECAADRCLGQLLWLLGRHDESNEAFSRAIALEELINAPALACWSRYWQARACADQAPRESEWLARRAHADATRLGLRRLTRVTEALLGSQLDT